MTAATQNLADPVEKEGSDFLHEITLKAKCLFPLLKQNPDAEDEEWCDGFLVELLKAHEEKDGRSRTSTDLGIIEHPFDMVATKTLLLQNPYHSTCIQAKVNATVGQGFKSENDRAREKAEKDPEADVPDLPVNKEIPHANTVLDDLTDDGFHSLAIQLAEEYWALGTCYIEVVRDESGMIKGLHRQPAEEVWVFVENRLHDFHYIVRNASSGFDGSIEKRFARFGELEDFIQRNTSRLARSAEDAGGQDSAIAFDPAETALTEAAIKNTTSELIAIKNPSSLSRHYGFPDWLSGVPFIELASCLTQHTFDFFFNRGVPEFMLWIIGTVLQKEDRDKLTAALKNHVGPGNARKTFWMNLGIPADNIRVQLEKLISDGKVGEGEEYTDTSNALALQICTAHRTPPVIAGVSIPGKMGAANEFVQALRAFQALVIQPAQLVWQFKLAATLGKRELSDLNLDGLEHLEFQTILNTIKPADAGSQQAQRKSADSRQQGAADTEARMRGTPGEGANRGRNLSGGTRS